MSKGTPSFGKHQSITHIRCRRCGRHSYHINKGKCSYCGFPSPRIRQEKSRNKSVLRRERVFRPARHMKPKTTHLGKHV